MNQAGTHDDDAAGLNHMVIDHAILSQCDFGRHRTGLANPARLAIGGELRKHVTVTYNLQLHRAIAEWHDKAQALSG